VDLLRDKATPEELAVAEAGVMEAEAGLSAAKTALSQAVLVAPFDGTVSDIYIREGEQVVGGQIGQAVMELGDLTTLQVETTDLRETDVGRIVIGQEVDITFDALPGTVLKGHIASISPKSTSEKGGVNYTTIIKFDQADPRLRWGMTAYVNITVS
jgi:HlyD family secretion protein